MIRQPLTRRLIDTATNENALEFVGA
nr:hypothetical protein [Metabacillus litoralis]